MSHTTVESGMLTAVLHFWKIRPIYITPTIWMYLNMI